MKNSYFSRDISGALKGIALILMFVHHFFTFPEWQVCGVTYPWGQTFADQFCAPTDLCVALFAFLTGYFTAFSEGVTLRRALRKISDFLLSYWLVCGVLICAAVAMGSFSPSVSGVVFELLGIRTVVMVFCWYVSFFCIVQVALPVLYRQDSRSVVGDVMVLLVLPTICLNIWKEMGTGSALSSQVWNLRQWYPCVAVGCLFGKYGLFQRWFDDFWNLPSRSAACRVLLCILMLWIGFRGRYYVQGIHLGHITIRSYDCPIVLTEDVFFAPVFLYGAANLLALCRKSPVVGILGKIGQRSMLMWFYHCFFFGLCGQKAQILLYWPKNPILVFLNGLLLCYLAAAVTEPVRKAVIGWKNRLVSRAAAMLPVR